MKGYFLTFEGLDGVGKTIIVQKINEWLKEQGISSIITFEPGGSSIGKEIRKMIFENSGLSSPVETFLLMADRVQHIKEKILPAVASGKIVLCDRYLDSTIAYQGFGKGFNEGVSWHFLYDFYKTFVLRPDLTFWIQADSSIVQERLSLRKQLNRLDKQNKEFYHQVKKGYQYLLEKEPNRIQVIDNNRPLEQTLAQIQKSILKLQA